MSKSDDKSQASNNNRFHFPPQKAFEVFSYLPYLSWLREKKNIPTSKQLFTKTGLTFKGVLFIMYII